jgi:hypothetical protein
VPSSYEMLLPSLRAEVTCLDVKKKTRGFQTFAFKLPEHRRTNDDSITTNLPQPSLPKQSPCPQRFSLLCPALYEHMVNLSLRCGWSG